MKRFLVLVTMIVGSILAAWFAAQLSASHRHQAEEEKTNRFDPALGRIEYVPPSELVLSPEKYAGKRVILAGIRSSGFEHSALRFDIEMQGLRIWVDEISSALREPYGDLSTSRHFGPAFYADKIVAEGTFFYEKKGGFGHLGGSNALFLIDRIYQSEPLSENEADRWDPFPKPPTAETKQ